MFSFLERIRKNPEHIKQHIAYGVSLFLFLIVVGVWVSAGGFSFLRGGAVADAGAPSVSDAPSPWTQVASVFKTAGAGIAQSFSDFKTAVAGDVPVASTAPEPASH